MLHTNPIYYQLIPMLRITEAVHTCPTSSGILNSAKFAISTDKNMYRYIRKISSNRSHVRQWENIQKACAEDKADKTGAGLETFPRTLCLDLHTKGRVCVTGTKLKKTTASAYILRHMWFKNWHIRSKTEFCELVYSDVCWRNKPHIQWLRQSLVSLQCLHELSEKRH